MLLWLSSVAGHSCRNRSDQDVKVKKEWAQCYNTQVLREDGWDDEVAVVVEVRRKKELRRPPMMIKGRGGRGKE